MKRNKQKTYTIFTNGNTYSYFASGILVHDDGIELK